jgi:hypothetical protein
MDTFCKLDCLIILKGLKMIINILIAVLMVLICSCSNNESNPSGTGPGEPLHKDNYVQGIIQEPGGTAIQGVEVSIRFGSGTETSDTVIFDWDSVGLKVMAAAAENISTDKNASAYHMVDTYKLYDAWGEWKNTLTHEYEIDPFTTGYVVYFDFDYTDHTGRELDKGFYSVVVSSRLVEYNEVTDFPPMWIIYDGVIDTTDASGAFTSPDIPINKNITIEVTDDQGRKMDMIGYYNGWVEFEYKKAGYMTRKDTVFVDKKPLTLNVILEIE